jgi:hypothetical protein
MSASASRAARRRTERTTTTTVRSLVTRGLTRLGAEPAAARAAAVGTGAATAAAALGAGLATTAAGGGTATVAEAGGGTVTALAGGATAVAAAVATAAAVVVVAGMGRRGGTGPTGRPVVLLRLSSRRCTNRYSRSLPSPIGCESLSYPRINLALRSRSTSACGLLRFRQVVTLRQYVKGQLKNNPAHKTRTAAAARKEIAQSLLMEALPYLVNEDEYLGPGVGIEEALEDESIFEEDSELLLFMTGLTVVGFLWMRRVSDPYGSKSWEIAAIYVNKLSDPPQYLGRVLLAKTLELAHEMNIDSITAHVASSNMACLKTLGYGLRIAGWARGVVRKEFVDGQALDWDYRDVHMCFEQPSNQVLWRRMCDPTDPWTVRLDTVQIPADIGGYF